MTRKLDIIKTLALLMIACTILLSFRSPESKYKELNKKIPTINTEELTRKDKDFNVLFSSKDCFYCTEYIDQLYLYLETLEGNSYSFDMDGLSEEERKKISDAYGLEKIPAILVVKGEKRNLISPEELDQKGVIQIEK